MVAPNPFTLNETSNFVKGNKDPPILGIQYKSFKKEPLDKLTKSGRKIDQEKVKIMGDILAEFGSMKPIDSHFSHPCK